MMRGTICKCPNCGAVLSEIKDVVRCNYCGSQVRVQQRTGFLERLDRTQVHHEALSFPLAVQPHSLSWKIAVGMVPLVTLAIIAGVMVNLIKSDNVRKQEATWDTSGAVFADSNGDGALDVVGRVRRNDTKQIYLAAFSGKDGKKLWTSEPIGDRSLNHTMPIGLAPTHVLAATSMARVIAHRLDDGSKAWDMEFSDRVERFCAGSTPEQVVIEFKDKSRAQVSLADGIVVEGSIGHCRELDHGDGHEPSATREILHARTGTTGPQSDAIPGMAIEGTIKNDEGVLLGYGKKTPGTGIPMIARFRADTLNALWTTVVPGIDPLSAQPRNPDPEQIAIGSDWVAILYPLEGGGHHHRLTVFDLETGKRRFDVESAYDSPLNSVGVCDSKIIVSRWGQTTAYDSSTGKKLWVVP